MTLAAYLASIGLEDGLGPDDIFWWAAGVTTVIGALTAIGFALRAGWRCIHSLVLYAEKGDQKLDKVIKEVAAIKAQVFPNGGASVLDTVRRIEVRQVQIEKNAEGIEAKAADTAEAVARIEGKLGLP